MIALYYTKGLFGDILHKAWEDKCLFFSIQLKNQHLTSNNRDRDEDENDLIEVQTLLSACSKVLGPLFVILLRKIMEYFEEKT